MKKSFWIIFIIIFIFGILFGYLLNNLINSNKDNKNISNENTINNENTTTKTENTTSFNLPTEGNDTIITTESTTTLRIINEYDKKLFSHNTNLLIMFASWCPNCQEEISEIEKILKHYSNISDVNVILIAHEYDDTIEDLITLIENDVNFGNIQVNVDLKRIIRKTIDPEASTIPISYVVDKKGNVLNTYNSSLTLEKCIEMIGK